MKETNEMKALEGIKILDFTHVQSGPTCTQLLAWFGADVIKVERPGVGDATRKQLVDVPGADSLYFTMLNHNKRSIELNSKNETGKEVLTRLIEECDVMVENFAPGALDRMGFTWERIQEINPRMILASIKGFGPGKYEDCKVYENVAQCAGGAASTTGFLDGPPLVTGAQIGDSGTGLHLCLGIVTALFHREKSGKGQKVSAAMQDGVLNLTRVKLRDQQRLAAGPLKEYSQFGEGVPFGEATPRAGNDSGGGQPGRILKCKGWETDPNAYTYFITQAAVWENVCDVIGEPEWKTKEGYATPPERLDKLNEIFDRIEQWTMTKTKFEVMDICNPLNIPVGPILSMKELMEDEGLRATGTIVEVDHPERGRYVSVGCPIKLSESPADVVRSPLLGEHTVEVLKDVLGYNGEELMRVIESGAVGEVKVAAE
jgi:formyl-CoA transferase